MNGSLDKYAESLEHIINFVMLGVYGTAIILFGGLLLLILAARNLFHPLFWYAVQLSNNFLKTLCLVGLLFYNGVSVCFSPSSY